MEDLIICPICGNSYKNLMSHVVRIHKHDKQYMIDTYGITKFVIDEVYNKQVECLTRGKETTMNDPVLFQKMISGIVGPNRNNNPSKAAVTRWATDGYREKMSVILSEAAKRNEEHMQELRERVAEWKLDPVISAKRNASQSKAMLWVWADDSRHDSNLGFHYKQVPHDSWYGVHYIMDSSYEAQLATILDELKEDYKYENKIVPYYYENDWHSYKVDFYIPRSNKYIEVKPTVFIDDPVVQAKYKAALSEGLDIIFITEDDIWGDLNSLFKKLGISN